MNLTFKAIAILLFVCHFDRCNDNSDGAGGTTLDRAKLDGVSHETGLPTTFSKTEKVLWRTPLSGPAGSTPVVWGDRIFLTTLAGPDLQLLAFGTDSSKLWEKTLGAGNQVARGGLATAET